MFTGDCVTASPLHLSLSAASFWSSLQLLIIWWSNFKVSCYPFFHHSHEHLNYRAINLGSYHKPGRWVYAALLSDSIRSNWAIPRCRFARNYQSKLSLRRSLKLSASLETLSLLLNVNCYEALSWISFWHWKSVRRGRKVIREMLLKASQRGSLPQSSFPSFHPLESLMTFVISFSIVFTCLSLLRLPSKEIDDELLPFSRFFSSAAARQDAQGGEGTNRGWVGDELQLMAFLRRDFSPVGQK